MIVVIVFAVVFLSDAYNVVSAVV